MLFREIIVKCVNHTTHSMKQVLSCKVRSQYLIWKWPTICGTKSALFIPILSQVQQVCMFVCYYIMWFFMFLGTTVAQWLRCCATNRKVAGSIPTGVNGFFIDIKSFRSHYGPGVDSASNGNEYQEYFLGVKSGRCVRLTSYHHPVPLSRNLGALTSWNPLGLSRPVTGQLYLFFMLLRVSVLY